VCVCVLCLCAHASLRINGRRGGTTKMGEKKKRYSLSPEASRPPAGDFHPLWDFCRHLLRHPLSSKFFYVCWPFVSSHFVSSTFVSSPFVF